MEGILERLTKASAPGAEPGGATTDLAGAGSILADLYQRLANLDVPHDEWEILYRQRLQVERDLLAGRAPGSVTTTEASTPLSDRVDASRARRAAARRGPGASDAIALAGFALIALDLAVTLTERRRRR